MEPLALITDRLQSDLHCYNRMLVPKLTQLHYKLPALACSWQLDVLQPSSKFLAWRT